MHERIYEQLKLTARDGHTITYSEIAQLAGLDMSSPADRNEIGRLLGEISAYECQLGHPMLSAIVVHKDNNMPGQGFFNLARELGLHQGTDDLAFFRARAAKSS